MNVCASSVKMASMLRLFFFFLSYFGLACIYLSWSYCPSLSFRCVDTSTFFGHFSSGSCSRFDIVYWIFFSLLLSCVCMFFLNLRLRSGSRSDCGNCGFYRYGSEPVRMLWSPALAGKLFASPLLWNRSFHLIPNFLSGWYVVPDYVRSNWCWELQLNFILMATNIFGYSGKKGRGCVREEILDERWDHFLLPLSFGWE